MIKELKKQLQIEVDTSYLYDILSVKNEDKNLSAIFHEMSQIEDVHAKKIGDKIKKAGVNPVIPPPSFRARLMVKLARVFGYDYILSSLISTEQKISRSIINNKIKNNERFSGKEMNHVHILKGLAGNLPMSGTALSRFEGKHKSVGSNALRAAVLGANDGLVSNLSLIMGVAGADTGNQTIVIAGFAGLLAGAISMALGEWLSVQSSRELHQRQIDIEAEEFETSPEEELKELILIYRAKGIEPKEAERLAKDVFNNKETAVESLVSEELGIDVHDLGGSSWEAAFTSFLLFSIGAIIPLIAFLFTSGFTATMVSLALSTVALFLIGAGITFFTGKSIWSSGIRQVIFGLVAAAITYGIGRLVGISIGG